MFESDDNERTKAAFKKAEKIARDLSRFCRKHYRKTDVNPAEITLALARAFTASAQASDCPVPTLVSMFTHFVNVAYEADGIECRTISRDMRGRESDDKPPVGFVPGGGRGTKLH